MTSRFQTSAGNRANGLVQSEGRIPLVGRERRMDPRSPVRWLVFWDVLTGVAQPSYDLCNDAIRPRRRLTHLPGDVLDIATGGFFLRPMIDVADVVAQGTCVRVRCYNEERHFDVRGTVRWIGRSAEHDCSGLGVRFDWGDDGVDAACTTGSVHPLGDRLFRSPLLADGQLALDDAWLVRP